MKHSLVPLGYKKYMWGLRRICVIFLLGTIAALILMSILGVWHDVPTGIGCSVLIMTIPIICLTPYLVHERVSQSVVEFTDECISVTDRHGRCWRTIRYTEISKVQVEKVTGFFFGQNKEKWCTEHICFYLTDSTDVPAVSYAKLYKHKDFFMMGYQKETVALLKKMLPHKFYGEEREISTES